MAAMKVQGGRMVPANTAGLIGAQERAKAQKIRQQVMEARDSLQQLRNIALDSGSGRRPAMYDKAAALLNSAMELLVNANAANGR